MPEEIQTSGAESTETVEQTNQSDRSSMTPVEQQQSATPEIIQHAQPESQNNGDSGSLASVLADFAAIKNAGQPQEQFPLAAKSGQTPTKFVRSYEGLDDGEARVFKDMSTDAYKKLYPIFLESKKWSEKEAELKKQLEYAQQTSSYDQENAWELSPEYKKFSASENNLSSEIDFCQQQLEKMESGEAIQWPELINGQLVLSQPFKPAPGFRATIINTMTKAHAMLTNVTNQKESFQSNYKSRHEGYINGLATTRQNIWKGVDLNMLAEKSKGHLAKFPEYARNKPEVKMLAEGLLIVEHLMDKIKTLEGRLNGKQIQSRTAANAGPTAEQITSGGKVGETVGDVSTMFEKIKAGM